MRLLLICAFATVADARPRASPASQPLVCPNATDSCELVITGKLVSSKRDQLAKWDNLQIATIVDGKRTQLYASINIPNRTRLKLKAGTRYRFAVAATRPFGAGNLWVTDAKAF